MPKKKITPVTEEGITSFIANCLAPTALRKEVMQPSQIYKYYSQFIVHYNYPQAHMQALSKHLTAQFHHIRAAVGTLYYCKIREDLIEK